VTSAAAVAKATLAWQAPPGYSLIRPDRPQVNASGLKGLTKPLLLVKGGGFLIYLPAGRQAIYELRMASSAGEF